ncbi:MAG TPA: zinc-dependent alcohol dehydrogenase family protein [Candidatus Nanopelagicaceae bacterium]
MRCIQTIKSGEFRLVELPKPEAGLGELVIKVGATGICGTDLHILAGEFPLAPFPLVPGHETAGTIVELGEGVVGFSLGDRVAVDPSIFCGKCEYCKKKRGNLCSNWGAIGDTIDGAFAEFVKLPAANAYLMPDGMSFASGALVEPVSCAVHALDRLDQEPGEPVLIYGAGTMGLILAQLLRHQGAGEVSIVDSNEARLRQAETFGFASVATRLGDLPNRERKGFDRVIDATGVTSVVQEALAAVGKGGTFMVFGVTPAGEMAAFEPFRIYNEEITIIGSMAVLASYGRAVDLVANGAVDANKMVTSSYGLDNFKEALGGVRRGVGLKTQIIP